jgi:GNAT superfamily N-acetyltransferase
LFLEGLSVRAHFRGKRVGDALLSRVAAGARAENYFGMLNVLGWNRPAIEFVQQRKVTFLGDWKTARLSGWSPGNVHGLPPLRTRLKAPGSHMLPLRLMHEVRVVRKRRH